MTTAATTAPVPPEAVAGAATATHAEGRGRRRWGLVGRYALLSVLAFVVLFPLYITVVNSLLTPEQIASKPPTFFPTDPVWDTYSRAWTDGHFGDYLVNSFIVTTIIVIGQLVTAILAGYAFAFLDFPFKRTIFVVFPAALCAHGALWPAAGAHGAA
jgi:sn-glycerol 3-phosphate transport system permease protein